LTSTAEWDGVPDAADVEIVFRARSTQVGSDKFVYAFGRATDMTDWTFYRGGGRATGTAAIASFVSGSYNQLASSTVDGSTDEWIWVRFRINGTDLKVKQWRDVDGEPGAWTIETTDSNLSAAGTVGLFLDRPTLSRQVIDVFGVGLNGDAAPMTALG